MVYFLLFCLILSLLMPANAFPGENVIKTLNLWHNTFRFNYNKQHGGIQHIMLDINYLDYFLAESKPIGAKFAKKIQIYTHIYMLRVKTEQNKEKLQKLAIKHLKKAIQQKEKCQNSNGNGTTKAVNAYDFFDEELADVYSKTFSMKVFEDGFSLHTLDDLVISYLLLLKKKLFNALNATNSMAKNAKTKNEFDYEQFQNECEREKDSEEIMEWMLSDLFLFFTTRQKLVKYFNGLSIEKESNSIFEAMQKFQNLFGFARMAIICEAYFEQLGFLVPFGDTVFYALLYKEFFQSDTKVGKWRAKITVEKFLYCEWANKFFDNELTKLQNKDNFQIIRTFIDDLKFYWERISHHFWHSEKIIRMQLEQLAKDARGNGPKKAIQIILAGHKKVMEIEWPENEKNFLLLWENGPSDTSLYQTFAICSVEVLERYQNDGTNELPSNSLNWKFFICIGKNLKNATVKDEKIVNLHIQKIEELLEDDGKCSDKLSDDFLDLLTENRNLWKELLNNDGIKKLKNYLCNLNEYFSATEEIFCSNSDESNESELFEEADDGAEERINGENELGGNGKSNSQIIAENSAQIKAAKKEENIYYENYNTNYYYLTETNWAKIKKNKKKRFNKGKKSEKNNFEAKNEQKFYKNEVKKEKEIVISEEPTVKENKIQNKNGKNNFESERQKDKAPKECQKSIEKRGDTQSAEKSMKKCCWTELKRFGIKKLGDFLNDFLMGHLYKHFLEEELNAEKCLQHLHISMFVRTAHAKLKFIESQSKKGNNKILKKLKEIWLFFISEELKCDDENVRFLMDQLLLLQNELDTFLLSSMENNCFIKKAIELLEEMGEIVTKINADGANEKQKSKQKKQIETAAEQHVVVVPAPTENANAILIQLHLHVFSSLKAKNLLKFAKEKCQNENNLCSNTKMVKGLTKLFDGTKIGCEEIDKYANSMEIMLKQQKLDKRLLPSIEQKQYNLIRTQPKLRENDLKMSDEISAFIQSYRIDSFQKRQILELKERIEKIVGEWADKITGKRTDAHVLVNGSHLLDAELDGSDLDLICVISDKINLLNFYGPNNGTLFTMLGKALNGAKINCITGKVPLIRIVYANTEIDLLFAPIPHKYLSTESFDPKILESDQIIKEITSENGIYSLAGYRTGKYLMALVPNPKMLSDLLKTVKIWARNRLIYSGIFGYFNGATLSIMTTKICVLFPNGPLSFLLYQFFSVFSQWHWSVASVQLEPLSLVSENRIVKFWPPPKIGQCSMNVITTKFPEQNAAFNVNTLTYRTIVEELSIAEQQLTETPKNWKAIFEEIKFEQKFRHFAAIFCCESISEKQLSNCGYQRSKIRRTLFEWASSKKVSDKLEQYHQIAQSERTIKCPAAAQLIEKMPLFGSENCFCIVWTVGLVLKDEKGNVNDLLPIYQLQNSNSNFHWPRLMHSLFFTDAQQMNEMFNKLQLRD